MTDPHIQTSKFLSYILRHHPESIGIQLDSQGWTNIDTLLAQAQQHNRPINRRHQPQKTLHPIRRWQPNPRRARAQHRPSCHRPQPRCPARHAIPRHRHPLSRQHPQPRLNRRQPPPCAPLRRHPHCTKSRTTARQTHCAAYQRRRHARRRARLLFKRQPSLAHRPRSRAIHQRRVGSLKPL